MVNLKIKNESNNELPSYGSEHASGFDLRAWVTDEDVIKINPGERMLIDTGISVEIPVGYEIQVRPRSGLALKRGISIVNTPGTIDADYRGKIGIILINHGSEVFEVKNGDRIAQAVMAPVCDASMVELINTDEFSETKRGAGGFGHTGVK